MARRPAHLTSSVPESLGGVSPVRRIGLEQEFFLVDEAGILRDRAPEFLLWCRREAQLEGIDPGSFKGECVRSMVEIATPPRLTLEDLWQEHLENLALALEIGKALGLRLYPLGTYPLPTTPTVEGDLRYRVKARTLGYERFLHAGRCAGVHLHLELPPGTVFPDVKKALGASPAARRELLGMYNLATALDPALIALTRSCPFYEGRMIGLAARTAFYRGSVPGLGGLYTNLSEVGGLQAYAQEVDDLIAYERRRYRAWFRAMNRAGLARRLFARTGGNRHRASWNPVRLNPVGTVEIRSMDGNYPRVVVAACDLICKAAHRVRQEGLRVEPAPGGCTFEVMDDVLLVPDFDCLSGDLFDAAVSRGTEAPDFCAYLDSLLAFAEPLMCSEHLACLRSIAGGSGTTDWRLAQAFASEAANITEAEGLRLVRMACEELEEQVFALREPGGVPLQKG